MCAENYTEKQKKLIQILYPDKYEELWGVKEETKKEEESPAE